jgi:NADH-quinone oxidoreductase subunit N
VARATGGDDISDFNGLGRRAPGLALAMLLAMLSLAGLPFTVGFL